MTQDTTHSTTRNTYVLCECCALMLANNDESGCRDYHHHEHTSLDMPFDTAISQGPHTWEGTFDLACHGHQDGDQDGTIRPSETFWVAESREPPMAGPTAASVVAETPIPDVLFEDEK